MDRTYESLNRLRFLRSSYLSKFLFVAFIGIHIPLISIIVLMFYNDQISKSSVFIVLLLFTLVATGLTLIVLRKLLMPLLIAKRALEDYTLHQSLPFWDFGHEDEAGLLMKTIQESVHTFDQALKEKEQITGLLSHNMRIPFTQIKALTHVLNNQLSFKDNSELGLINLICDHQLKNTEELFRNLNLQPAEAKKTAVEIEALIKKLVLAAESQLKAKNLEVISEFDPTATTILTEEQKVSLVFENILNNAIKFSYPGKKIFITCKQEGIYYTLSVRDEGIGFPKDFTEKIFQPNAHTGRLGTMGEPTNGIGLSLSRKNIQKLGGDIIAFSEGDNQGAKFTLLISGGS